MDGRGGGTLILTLRAFFLFKQYWDDPEASLSLKVCDCLHEWWRSAVRKVASCLEQSFTSWDISWKTTLEGATATMANVQRARQPRDRLADEMLQLQRDKRFKTTASALRGS
eukprot:6412458-Amphidinium_carterae.1